MDRRRHARTPVNINAMLIGQTTVPKGCRVRNVSQQGMLLQCEPDGRLLTFSKGDKVEIHLTVQYAGEKKSLTIPSSVRHVNEAYIYVEFQHPDLKLVELIESYRVSEAHELEASVNYEGAKPDGPRITANTDTGTSMQTDAQQTQDKKVAHRPFYYSLLTLVLVICIITGGYIYATSVDNRLGMLESITDRQTAELSEMRERVFSSTLQEGRYASLNARMTALTDAFSSLENKLTRLISQRLPDMPEQTRPVSNDESHILITSRATQKNAGLATTLPADVAPLSATPGETAETPPVNRHTDTQIITARPAAEAAPMAETADQSPAPPAKATAAMAVAPEPVTETADTREQDTETSTSETAAVSLETAPAAPSNLTTAVKQGPWVINLLSSTDKGYVERYAERARSRDVAVEVNSADVKGRTYWRMQITGFSSASAARAEAGGIREKLGIKDVWIFRR